jgi:hypothetical protein
MHTVTIPKHTDDRIKYLQSQGYIWDKRLSIAAAGVILIKDKDFYLFDMEYNEYHNPELLRVFTI